MHPLCHSGGSVVNAAVVLYRQHATSEMKACAYRQALEDTAHVLKTPRCTTRQSLFTLHLTPHEHYNRRPALKRNGLWHHWQTAALPVAVAGARRGGVVGENV